MLELHRKVLWLFLGIFAATAILTVVGVIDIWFIHPQAARPYLSWLIGLVIAEVVGTVLLFARRGLKYLPDVRTDTTPLATSLFMRDFISQGSSIVIVSNRLGWLAGAKEVQAKMQERARQGTRFEIFTVQEVAGDFTLDLRRAGVKFYRVDDPVPPEARFTLINADRSGAQRLAIARGTHPEHEITIFDSNSGPQMIAMAKDIVRKSRTGATEIE